MVTSPSQSLKHVFTVRCHLSPDLAAVAVSWILVVSALYTATFVVGSQIAGGMLYFLFYAIIGATLFGVGIPLFWTVVIRRRPLDDLGLSRKGLALSLALQLVFAVVQYTGTLAAITLPSPDQLLPLLALALAIGFFEAVFWRGWILLRLEAAFGIVPAILVGSLLYALYHVGYGMPIEEMTFLFFIGVLYAVVFRLTKNVFVLVPILQPMGQLTTLIRDGLSLPLAATLGFLDVIALMAFLIWLANRYYRRHLGTTLPALD